MANYPTTPTTFATRSNGQTIDASHVNTMQEEISAIEDGLLSGTARLNSSNSTVANLSVAGGSTLASLHATSTVTFDSSVTFGGNVSITGTLLVGGASVGGQVAAKVTSSGNQSINNNAWTGLSFDVESYDSTAAHSTGANSSRLTLTSSGMWLFGGQAVWNVTTNPSTLVFMVRVRVNDGDVVAGDVMPAATYPLSSLSHAVCGHYYASGSADYLTLQVHQNSGGALNVVGSTGSGIGPTHFWVQKVG